jgi:ABC-type cobalamin/Fe3+-siderophores transport system ATPase subunit
MCSAAVPRPAVPNPERSRAVLVGVAAYERLDPLPAVANNVTALRDVLTDRELWGLPDRHCVAIIDPSDPREVLDAVHTAAREAEDGLVVYLAGHGLVMGDRLRVENLMFAYGPTATPVLDGLDLTVEEGEHVAILGASGIGKSTLANLLSGLLAGQRGRIELGAVPLAQIAPPRLRRLVALIPQEAYVFDGTLRENLTYLIPAAADSDLDRTVDALGMRPLVARLGGYEAQLAVGDIGLSQGERQLVALARVHLSPASVVILDEATCHLDPQAEALAERVRRAAGHAHRHRAPPELRPARPTRRTLRRHPRLPRHTRRPPGYVRAVPGARGGVDRERTAIRGRHGEVNASRSGLHAWPSGGTPPCRYRGWCTWPSGYRPAIRCAGTRPAQFFDARGARRGHDGRGGIGTVHALGLGQPPVPAQQRARGNQPVGA